MDDTRRVAIMGVTGSIGRQALDVIRATPDHYDIVAVAGGQDTSGLASVVREFSVRSVAVPSDVERRRLAPLVSPDVDILIGPEGLAQLSRTADVVVNAVVGFAGLPVTLATLEAGKRLALANKESLIAAAPLVELVRYRGGEILPVDSEHCALHQCLRSSSSVSYGDVARLWLTASGGPFREWTDQELSAVTVSDALRHPTWTMGPKVTIDSSTLMNKGLEVLEASALFAISVDQIGVVIHPQSIVHSMVEYVDGSVIAQLSNPDMRLPISYSLAYPERRTPAWGRIDFTATMQLDFSPPDGERFPALGLAYAAARRGGAAPAWLSAANEVAVEAFLADRIKWRDIVSIVATTLDAYQDVVLTTVGDLVDQDALARRVAHGTLPY